MKRFGSLLLAAVLGSSLTLLSTQWFSSEKEGVKIEHLASVPSSQVAYTVNEKGESVPLDFTTTAEKVTKAVVHIKSISDGQVAARDERQNQNDPFQYFFDQRQQQRGPSQSSGSGVIINADGYIVTNNHVVQGADKIEVTLSDNQTFTAEVVGTDADTDLAVIKINQKELPYLSFVNSDQSKVGEWVLAVGNPFNLNSTVTAGIISAKGRNINLINSNSTLEQKGGRTAIESFIQTDAAINPGNSGGALVNLQGGLLGINTAIASPTGSYSGYGFAVPSNIVSKIVEDLLAFGTVQRGWLGIQVLDVANLPGKADLSVKDGAFVSGFGEMESKSAAKEAGLQKGDVIVMLDETRIRTSSGLIEYIGLKHPGDKVKVTVNRDGKEKTFTIALKNREGKLGSIKREEKDAVASLGIDLVDVDSKVLKQLNLTNGVKVKVENGKIARYTDMKDGFIVTHINDKEVKSAREVNEFLKSKKAGDLITFSGVYENYPREYIYAIRI
ncbi:Do family serine endopeptidase [soil metagenome]